MIIFYQRFYPASDVGRVIAIKEQIKKHTKKYFSPNSVDGINNGLLPNLTHNLWSDLIPSSLK